MNSQESLIQMSNRESTRAKRSSNFSTEERRKLVAFANRYRSILENKKTDQITTAAKTNCWLKIEEEFNMDGLGPYRDHKSLKFKYEAIKRELRKKDTSEWRATGGGPPLRKIESGLTDEEIILRDTIIVGVDGLEPQDGDSDSGHMTGVSASQLEVGGESILLEEISAPDAPLEMDWAHVTPRMLQTPVHPALVVSAPDTIDNEVPIETEGTESTPKVPSRRVRRTVQKKSRASASSKFEQLAEKKLMLVQKKERLLDLQIRKAEIELKIAERTLANMP